MTRRAFAAAAVGLAACQRRKASGYSGFAFIANQEGEAVAVVDLAVFALARIIRLSGSPTEVIAHPTLPLALALTPANGTIHEIRSDTLAFSRKIAVGREAVAMRLSPDGGHLYVLCRQPRVLIRFSVANFQVDARFALPADPVDFDIDRTGRYAAISHGAAWILSLIDLKGDASAKPIATSGEIGAVRFQSDSSSLIAANRSERMLSIYHVASRRLIVNLPLSVRPDNLCIKADGGELFVTGEGMDGVVVVSPFYTPFVSETVLAGHAPGAMAASLLRGTNPQYLFVANPRSGDVSVLNIAKRQVVAVTTVGNDPGSITITPDDQYALVLNRGSGDVAVLRVANITKAAQDFHRSRKGPLFMMIPVGSRPVSASVMTI